MFWYEFFNILFSYEDDDIGTSSNLHSCTFKSFYGTELFYWFKIFISFSGVSRLQRQPYMEFGGSSFILAEKLNLVGLIGRSYKIRLKEFWRGIASQSPRLNLGQPCLCIFGFLCCFSRTESTRFLLLDYRFLSKTFAYIWAFFSRTIWRGLE